MKVLIADDSHTNLRIAATIIQKLLGQKSLPAAEITLVTTGEEALDNVREAMHTQTPIPFIYLDQNMGQDKLSGVSTAEQILRIQAPLKQKSLIFICSSETDLNVPHGIHFVPKPLTAAKLEPLIDQLALAFGNRRASPISHSGGSASDARTSPRLFDYAANAKETESSNQSRTKSCFD